MSEEEARKRAEAAAQAEKEGGSGKKSAGQKIYEKIMQQKRIVGALMEEKKEKAEQQAASQRAKDNYRAGEKAYDIAQAKAIQQQARDDYRAGERGYAVQQAEKAASQQARDDFRAEERGYSVSQMVIPAKGVLSQISHGIAPLLNSMNNQWDNFVSNLTTPTVERGPILGSEQFNTSMLVAQMHGLLVDNLLFDGKLTHIAANLKQSLESSPVYNGINNWLAFGTGATLQFLDDNSFGIVGKVLHVNWENGSDAFQAGMEFGNTVSKIQGVVEFVVGAATTAFFLSTMPPTGGLAVACAAGTGGVCLPVGGVALTVEGAGALLGGALSTHGIALEVSANRPLQIRGNGGSNLPPNPEKGFFGTNAQNTGTNSDRLYKNMGSPKRLDGYQAHHIVPSFSGRPAAVKARQILEEFGVDINNAGNGVMIPGNVNGSLNKPAYEEAILDALEYEKQKGATQADILELLQDIGNQIKSTGKYP